CEKFRWFHWGPKFSDHPSAYFLVRVGQITEVKRDLLVRMRFSQCRQNSRLKVRRANQLHAHLVYHFLDASFANRGVCLIVWSKGALSLDTKAAVLVISDLSCACLVQRRQHRSHVLLR